jgi:hypothetical protein
MFTQFITSGSTTADFTSSTIENSPKTYTLQITLVIGGTGSPSGNVYFQESLNNSSWYNVPIDKAMGALGSTAKNFTHTDGNEAIALAGNTSTTTITVKLASPAPYVRVFYDQAGTGAAAMINGYHVQNQDG